MSEEEVLNEIIDYYLHSHDFNGLPIYQMNYYNYDFLCELIDEGLIEAISERDVINPHIKGFSLNLSILHQKENASSIKKHTVFYPTRKALENVKVDYSKPYTIIMQKGEEQFKVIYFDIEILERYANNPKFLIMDNGYRGCIYPRHEYCEDTSIEDEYIKDYGMAYIDAEQLKRAVGVFVVDLNKLSSQKQMMWKGFELSNQENCRVNEGFVKNLIYGQWVTSEWIFHALIEEMVIINKQCESMKIPRLFNKTFGTHYSEMPEGFRNILLPTLKNYYDFVLVLEKMVVHNISYKTFQKDSLNIRAIERCDESGKEKGSLVMLEEWFSENMRTNESVSDLIIKQLKNIRKIRQVPAHELKANTYDIELYQKQVDLMNDTYSSIRAIRLFFSNHPLAKTVSVPECLVSGQNIVNY